MGLYFLYKATCTFHTWKEIFIQITLINPMLLENEKT